MYDLNTDAITKKPKLYCELGLRELYSLDKSKEIVKEYFIKNYSFNSNLKEYIKNLENCKTVYDIEKYVCYAGVKGLEIKVKSNLNTLNKNF